MSTLIPIPGLADVAGQITTPLCITDPDSEQYLPGSCASPRKRAPVTTAGRRLAN